MARIRSIKPSFFRHEGLQEIERDHPGCCAMLVFSALWGHCDKDGTFQWRPNQLKLDILPFLPFVMAETLQLLLDAGMIVQFESNGRTYGNIPTFSDHQRITGSEKTEDAAYPAPPKHLGNTLDRSIDQEGKGREEEREEEGKGSAEPSHDDSAPSDSLLTFPVIGKGAKEWHLTADYVAELAGDYPGLDVLGECRLAHAWAVANVTKRKTARGMASFLVRWLNRAVDSGGGRKLAAVAAPRQSDRHIAPSHRPKPVNDAGEDWFEECKRLHGGKCGLSQANHRHQMARDAADGASA